MNKNSLSLTHTEFIADCPAFFVNYVHYLEGGETDCQVVTSPYPEYNSEI